MLNSGVTSCCSMPYVQTMCSWHLPDFLGLRSEVDCSCLSQIISTRFVIQYRLNIEVPYRSQWFTKVIPIFFRAAQYAWEHVGGWFR